MSRFRRRSEPEKSAAPRIKPPMPPGRGAETAQAEVLVYTRSRRARTEPLLGERSRETGGIDRELVRRIRRKEPEPIVLGALGKLLLELLTGKGKALLAGGDVGSEFRRGEREVEPRHRVRLGKFRGEDALLAGRFFARALREPHDRRVGRTKPGSRGDLLVDLPERIGPEAFDVGFSCLLRGASGRIDRGDLLLRRPATGLDLLELQVGQFLLDRGHALRALEGFLVGQGALLGRDAGGDPRLALGLEVFGGLLNDRPALLLKVFLALH